MKLMTVVLHCKKLTERYDHIHSELKSHGITDYSIITEFDADELKPCMISNFYVDDKNRFDESAAVTLKKHGHTESIYRTLKKTEISLIFKHIAALRLFARDPSYDALLVLEDDFCFDRGNVFQEIENLPDNWDVLFLGGAFDHNILSIKQFIGDYILARHPATNTSSSIVYNQRSAKRTLDTITPFYLPLDWHLNDVYYRNNFNVYHSYPYICGQLSHRNNGFKGSIEHD